MSETTTSVGEVAHVALAALRRHRECLQMQVQMLIKQEARLRRDLAKEPAVEPEKAISAATLELIAMQAIEIEQELEQVPGNRVRLQREIGIADTLARQFAALIPGGT